MLISVSSSDVLFCSQLKHIQFIITENRNISYFRSWNQTLDFFFSINILAEWLEIHLIVENESID